MRKRGKDIQKLKQVLLSLIAEEQLVERFRSSFDWKLQRPARVPHRT